MPKTHKLYCFVDETGQDTLGAFFIVAVVVTDNQQHELENRLEAIEQSVGKKTKWMKTRDSVRQAYASALTAQSLPCKIFAKSFRNSKTGFDELEVLTVVQALNVYRDGHKIEKDNYKAIITVDGLSKIMAVRMGSEFRKLGVKTRKVIGKRDESTAIIRLADAAAGLVREAQEGRPEYKKLVTKLKRRKLLNGI